MYGPGEWAEHNLPTMSDDLLVLFSKVLDEENPDLFKWLTGGAWLTHSRFLAMHSFPDSWRIVYQCACTYSSPPPPSPDTRSCASSTQASQSENAVCGPVDMGTPVHYDQTVRKGRLRPWRPGRRPPRRAWPRTRQGGY